MTGRAAPIILVGCGKMGGALLAGWLARASVGAERPVIVVEPTEAATSQFRSGSAVTVLADASQLPPGSDPAAIVFAVKPQGMDGVVPAYKRFAGRSVFLSIAAGRPIKFFEQHLGDKVAVVRAMPNTPAAIGRGISV